MKKFFEIIGSRKFTNNENVVLFRSESKVACNAEILKVYYKTPNFKSIIVEREVENLDEHLGLTIEELGDAGLYELQANTFLKNTATTLIVNFSHYGKHFESDTYKRNIYEVSLKREKRPPYIFRFGDSVVNSTIQKHYMRKVGYNRKVGYKPTNYSILACLDSYCPISFDNFCADYGYDTDSRSAYRTFEKCLQERSALEAMFSPDELEQLSSIA